MGQKVNPNGLRLGVNTGWQSSWFAEKRDFATYLNNDIGESELAELLGESRQSVHDAISKAKKQTNNSRRN